MAKWLLCQSQAGEGCDYTIACGADWTTFEAPDEESAWKEVRRLAGINDLDGDSPYGAIGIIDGERARDQFVLFKVSQEIDLIPRIQGIVSDWEVAQTKRDAQEREAKEWADYERLQKKFGK